MIVKNIATAGTLESSDLQITIEPREKGINIDLSSSVQKQFGRQIILLIEKVCSDLNVEGANIKIVDKGAMNYVIEARLKAALFRASGNDGRLEYGYN